LVEIHLVRDDVPVDLPEQPPAQPEPSRLRASDADRDRVADQLREALAEGRLTPEEHSERIDQVYSARTYAELAPLLEDLPATGAPTPQPQAPPLPAPLPQSSGIVAIFGGAERKGRWLVEPETNVFTLFGGVDLDFREAVLSQREVTINVTCIFGGVEIKVPPGVRVIDSGSAIFGGRSVDADQPADPNAPVIRLTGYCLFGGIDVTRQLPRAERQVAREQRRVLRDERRDRLRELRAARRDRRHY
jgi:hypothetical protein